MGVAWGTFAGSICGILAAVFYTMPRAREMLVSAAGFGQEAILRPLLCFLPLLAYLAGRSRLQYAPLYLTVAVLLSAFLLLSVGRIQLLWNRSARTS
jgi:hypothetical protein